MAHITNKEHAAGLTIFFPAYNDGGTIASMVISAITTARQLTEDYEIIVVNDGSTDSTSDVLSELERVYPRLRVINHSQNKGYGAALRTGFSSAREIVTLWNHLTNDVDLVNGYKISRSDPLHRIIIGRCYHYLVKILFGLQIRDVDCDFRLLRRSIFERVSLTQNSGVICLEIMRKVQDAGYSIVEVPVHHYHRAYGKSQFFNFRRVFRTAIDVLKLWRKLVWGKSKKEHL